MNGSFIVNSTLVYSFSLLTNNTTDYKLFTQQLFTVKLQLMIIIVCKIVYEHCHLQLANLQLMVKKCFNCLIIVL